MNKQLTALALLVAGTITGNALASCRSGCGSCKEPEPKCCYTKKVCKPAQKKPVYEYCCDQGTLEHKDAKADKAAKSERVGGYSGKGRSKSGNGQSKHMNGNHKNKK